MNAEELREFSEEIAQLFSEGKIRAPVHLSGGNEAQLIDIFKHVRSEDWVFSTHRSHYHALLKGVPRETVQDEILKGHSMHLNFKEYKFFTSSIVGGCLPIALGVAMAIKRRKGAEKVWCFVGDMAAFTGIAYECAAYANAYELDYAIILEDNGFSVQTPTRQVWKWAKPVWNHWYKYDRIWPHVGCGTWVTF